jgi:hypothetical protein
MRHHRAERNMRLQEPFSSSEDSGSGFQEEVRCYELTIARPLASNDSPGQNMSCPVLVTSISETTLGNILLAMLYCSLQ